MQQLQRRCIGGWFGSVFLGFGLNKLLDVLPGCATKAFDIDLENAPQSKASALMPQLAFGKLRFDPNLPLPHRLLVSCRLLICCHPIQIELIDGMAHRASNAARGALRPEGTGLTRISFGTINPGAFVSALVVQGFTLWAAIIVTLSMIFKH